MKALEMLLQGEVEIVEVLEIAYEGDCPPAYDIVAELPNASDVLCLIIRVSAEFAIAHGFDKLAV